MLILLLKNFLFLKGGYVGAAPTGAAQIASAIEKDFIAFQLGLKKMAQYLHTGNAAKPCSIKRPSDPKP
jgi:hypothetical protein